MEREDRLTTCIRSACKDVACGETYSKAACPVDRHVGFQPRFVRKGKAGSGEQNSDDHPDREASLVGEQWFWILRRIGGEERGGNCTRRRQAEREEEEEEL